MRKDSYREIRRKNHLKNVLFAIQDPDSAEQHLTYMNESKEKEMFKRAIEDAQSIKTEDSIPTGKRFRGFVAEFKKALSPQAKQLDLF